MFTSFVCVACHPTLFSAFAACSWTFFFGLYGPLYVASRIHDRLWSVQSLYGTLSRPTVQSSRGSTAANWPPEKFVSLSAAVVFQPAFDSASGRPTASTAKKFTRFCEGWWNPQHPKWLPECGKFSRSPQFEFQPLGSPSRTEAWNARMVSFPFLAAWKPVQTLSNVDCRA